MQYNVIHNGMIYSSIFGILFGILFGTVYGIRNDIQIYRLSIKLLPPPFHLPLPLGDSDVFFHLGQSPETCNLSLYELPLFVNVMNDEVGNLFDLHFPFRLHIEL